MDRKLLPAFTPTTNIAEVSVKQIKYPLKYYTTASNFVKDAATEQMNHVRTISLNLNQALDDINLMKNKSRKTQ